MNKIGYAQVREKQINIVLALLKAQLLACFIVVILSLLYVSTGFAGSVLLGAIASVIPNLYFAYYSFRPSRQSKASARINILANICLGECIKFVLVICLLVISFRLANEFAWLQAQGILIGFGVTYLSIVFVPVLLNKK